MILINHARSMTCCFRFMFLFQIYHLAGQRSHPAQRRGTISVVLQRKSLLQALYAETKQLYMNYGKTKQLYYETKQY